MAVPRRVLALKTLKTHVKDESQDVALKTSLQDVGPNSQDVTGRFTRRAKTFGGMYTLEARRHETLPYAASPYYVEVQAVIKSAATVSFLLRLSAKSSVIRARIFALC